MDRRVKERLVGATILVVLVVLIVPELLSGPKPAATVPESPLPGAPAAVRSVTVDLATNKATVGADEAASAPSPVAQPAAPSGSTITEPPAAQAEPSDVTGRVPGTTSQEPDATGITPPHTTPPSVAVLQAQPPAAAPLDAGRSSPKPPSAVPRASGVRDSAPIDTMHRGWAAQLGSFAGRANAEKLERQLRAQGFAATLSASGSGKALRYRLRVGPFADRGAAEKVIAKLKKAGHAARVVAP